MSKSFADMLRSRRLRAGMSQRRAASEIGVSHAAWSAWETGKASPLVGRLPALARLFGISTTALIHGVDLDAYAERPEPPGDDEPLLSLIHISEPTRPY